MAGSLAPQWFMQIFDDAGKVASGAKMFSYVSGTSTPAPIYADQPCHVPLNSGGDDGPWTLNAAGRGEFWLLDGITYRLRIETADGDMLVDRSGITGGGGGDGSASTPGITILENFPEKDAQWARDDAGDLWNGETELGFRSDFDVNGMNWLHLFKSKFSSALGIATGRFAVYGEESALLYDGALPDGDYYGIEEFAVPIDISSYRYLAICMDPGVSAAEQPITQTMTRWPLPIASSFGPGNRWVSAHMVEHAHNSAWPETAPGLPVVPTVDPVGSIKYCITRWCAIGVSV